MTDHNEALRLAEWLQSAVQTYPQMSEDEPGGYCTEVDQVMDQAAALLRQLSAERDQLRAEVERYRHLRSGQSWPAVFASHDAPEPLRGGELDTAIDNARTTHKDEG